MNVDITVLVGILSAITGIVLGIWKNKKDGEKSLKEDTVQNTVVATKLDTISKGVDDIRIDFKTQAREIQRMQLDQARLDESVKSAHHRIDELQEIIKKEGVR